MAIYVADIALGYIAAVVQLAFYGVYVLSFGICLHILLKKRKGCYQYHVLATVVLFFLASTNVLLYTIDDIGAFCLHDLGHSSTDCWKPSARFIDAKSETALASSAVADAILLWRCYKIWGRQRKIMILPIFLYLCGHVIGFVLCSSDVKTVLYMVYGVISNPAVAAVSAGVIGMNNLLLTTLIAFRIFQMSREIVAYLGPRSKSMYGTVINVTLESGLLYSTFLGILFIVTMVEIAGGLQASPAVDVLALQVLIDVCCRIWSPIAGIVSTIIIVRVTLGLSLDSVESAILSFRAASRRNEEALVIDVTQSASGVTLKGTDAADIDSSE